MRRPCHIRGVHPGYASSCSEDVTVKIQMTAGQACWTYRGVATSFFGRFEGAARRFRLR
jgi:hypothetical protein